jgi:type I restriction enzyme S subunit
MENKPEISELGEVFDVNPSRVIKRGEVTPFIPMEALPEHSREVSRVYYREYSGSGTRFKNGDTLIARITPCLENGKTVFISCLAENVVAHGSTEYIVLSGKQDVSESLYGYYLARSPDFRAYAIAHMEGTSGRQRVPASAVENYRISLPPLPEQRGIAELLGSLDDKIALNRHMNQTLETLAQAIFKSWFIDFEPVRAKMEGSTPAGMDAETAALFPDSMDGDVPSGWRKESLDQIAHFLNGLALQKYPPIGDKFLPVIKIAQLRTENTDGADKASASILKEYIIDNGGILFSWSGSLDVVIWCGGKGALNQHLFKVTSEKYPKWIYYYWILHHLQGFQAIAAGKATTMGHIQRHHLSEAKVIVPDTGLLREMDKAIAPLLEKIILNKLESNTLANLRDTLLPKLLSGEVTVDNINPQNGS